MRGSGNKKEVELHIVSAWSKEKGICFGQKGVKEKRAIKGLLEEINVEG
jgi:hypothetical protein